MIVIFQIIQVSVIKESLDCYYMHPLVYYTPPNFKYILKNPKLTLIN
jgi:hypothetical protein